jgi:hypothetical protein
MMLDGIRRAVSNSYYVRFELSNELPNTNEKDLAAICMAENLN